MHFPGELVPVPRHILREESFSNIQPKPSLTQFYAMLSLVLSLFTGERRSVPAPMLSLVRKM